MRPRVLGGGARAVGEARALETPHKFSGPGYPGESQFLAEADKLLSLCIYRKERSTKFCLRSLREFKSSRNQSRTNPLTLRCFSDPQHSE